VVAKKSEGGGEALVVVGVKHWLV